MREPLQTKEWLPQDPEGPSRPERTHSRHHKSRSRPERAYSRHERADDKGMNFQFVPFKVQFVLEGPLKI